MHQGSPNILRAIFTADMTDQSLKGIYSGFSAAIRAKYAVYASIHINATRNDGLNEYSSNHHIFRGVHMDTLYRRWLILKMIPRHGNSITTAQSSSAGESHPHALTEPDVHLS